MPGKKTPIIWKNEVVGVIEDLKVDMFDLYGKWLPSNTLLAQEFLAALQAGTELEVQVGVGIPKLIGTIDIEPDQEINIKHRPEL